MVWIRRSISVLSAFFCAIAVTGCFGESYRHHKKCTHVQHEFHHQKLGSRDLIPDSPIHDPAVSICFDGSKEPHRKSCCTHGAEVKYMKAAEIFFKDNVRHSFLELNNITHDLASYQERILKLITDAQNRTSVILTSMHKIPLESHHEAVSSFFLDLEQYVKRQTVDFQESVTQFFNQLFPSVYSYILSDPTFVHYDKAFLDCLVQNQDEIKPFVNVPRHLWHRLQQVFGRTRAYIDTLSVIIEAINTTDHLAIEDECRHAVTRLQYCSRCDGHLNLKMCHGFCLNVMRGCLATVSEISPEWDELISTIDGLVRSMYGKFNVEELLLHIDKNISDGILQAMDDGGRIFKKVKEYCHSSQSSIGDATFRPPETLTNMAPRRPSGHSRSLLDHVSGVLKKLQDYRGIYNRLADNICRQSSLYEQDMRSDQCWNGSAISQYVREVPEANVISQARFNQEVAVSVKPDYKLLQVRDKLTHMRKNLTDLLKDSKLMMGDYPAQNVYGSGDQNIHHHMVINEMDDEDLYTGASGSGGGAGSGDTPVPPTYDSGTKPTPEVTPKGSAGVAKISWAAIVLGIMGVLCMV